MDAVGIETSVYVYAIVWPDAEYGFVTEVFGVYATNADAEADLPNARKRTNYLQEAPYVEEWPWKSLAPPAP